MKVANTLSTAKEVILTVMEASAKKIHICNQRIPLGFPPALRDVVMYPSHIEDRQNK